MLDVSYDPRTGRDGNNGAKKFLAADGYHIEATDSGKLTVSHSGRSASWFAPAIDYVLPLVAVAAPVVVPEPAKVVEAPRPVEAPKPAPVVQQAQRPQQYQGKGNRR